MALISVGTDIVEIERIQKVFSIDNEKFLKKIFTPSEIEEAKIKNKMLYSFLASRWSVKEATIKALTPLIDKIYPAHCIEVRKTKQYPEVFLLNHDYLPLNFEKKFKLHCSISHEEKYAVATVILESI